VRDVASLSFLTDPEENRVFNMTRPEGATDFERLPAVSIAVAKRPGASYPANFLLGELLKMAAVGAGINPGPRVIR
jgi:hypothetical protein